MEVQLLALFLSVCVYMHACESIFFWKFEAKNMFDELDVDHGGIVSGSFQVHVCVHFHV